MRFPYGKRRFFCGDNGITACKSREMTSVLSVIATHPVRPWAIDLGTAFAVLLAAASLGVLLRVSGLAPWLGGGHSDAGRRGGVPVPVRANSSFSEAASAGLETYMENHSPDELGVGREANRLGKAGGAR